jgi:hypothetical protein
VREKLAGLVVRFSPDDRMLLHGNRGNPSTLGVLRNVGPLTGPKPIRINRGYGLGGQILAFRN